MVAGTIQTAAGEMSGNRMGEGSTLAAGVSDCGRVWEITENLYTEKGRPGVYDGKAPDGRKEGRHKGA